MTTEQVESMLKSYRVELGRLGNLKFELAQLQKDMEAERRDMADTLASPKPPKLTDMPHGTNISKPTEKFGIMLADGYKSELLEQLEQQYADVKQKYEECATKVSHITVWLKNLTERERWVVENKFIDGMSWKLAVPTYVQKFKEPVSKDMLKRLKARAMNKIYDMAVT